MKNFVKIFCLISILTGLFCIDTSYAANIEGLNLGAKSISADANIGGAAKDIGIRIIDIVRYIFSAILVLIIVYLGAKMIMSMGSNEDNITSAKNGIWYAIVGIIFINFPVAIYNAIFNPNNTSGNLLINEAFFTNFILQIINFLEIIVAGLAVVMIVITGIKLITSRGRDEKISEAKSKILWVIIALVFIGFIEAYKKIVIAEGGLQLGEVTNIFSTGANLLLYMAGPIIMLFLTIAGYYYITSNGNEDRAKKGKSIIINTLIGIVLLLCCFVVLNDISLLIK